MTDLSKFACRLSAGAAVSPVPYTPAAAAAVCAPPVLPQRAGRHGAPWVDFEREVYCLLGLPLDAIDVDDAVTALRHAAFNGTPCLVSTPNLNFVASAQSDPAFRASVVLSQLSLIDGMPLVWIAKLLGLPFRERVAGSEVFERLSVHAGPPIEVYFFGGPDGAAAAACERVSTLGPGLHCVGFDTPGFVPVEQMSDDVRITAINRSGAQFLVVALGAKKGQEWLLRNRSRLEVPVLCHLGAVVNFLAGTVRRAPALVQRLGLEWLWRIVEEPALWRRYAIDGRIFFGLLATRVLPLAFARLLARVRESGAGRTACRAAGAALPTGRCRLDGSKPVCEIHLAGAWNRYCLQPLRLALARAAITHTRLVVNLRDADEIDSAFIGLLLIAQAAFPDGLRIVDAPPAIVRRLRWHCAEFLLEPGALDHV